MVSATLTVYFDGAHWKALYELRYDGLLSIAEHVFGAEPTDPELWEWWRTSCLDMSLPVSASRPVENTKTRTRKMREVVKAFDRTPVSEEVRAAARITRLERRRSAKIDSRNRKDIAEQEKRVLTAAKRKKKKRGH